MEPAGLNNASKRVKTKGREGETELPLTNTGTGKGGEQGGLMNQTKTKRRGTLAGRQAKGKDGNKRYKLLNPNKTEGGKRKVHVRERGNVSVGGKVPGQKNSLKASKRWK